MNVHDHCGVWVDMHMTIGIHECIHDGNVALVTCNP